MDPLEETDTFNVYTDYKEKKVLVDFADGSTAFMKHKRIDIIFVHRRTNDAIRFGLTGRGNCYRTAYNCKEEPIRRSELESEIKRLGGSDMTLFLAELRMLA